MKLKKGEERRGKWNKIKIGYEKIREIYTKVYMQHSIYSLLNRILSKYLVPYHFFFDSLKNQFVSPRNCTRPEEYDSFCDG